MRRGVLAVAVMGLLAAAAAAQPTRPTLRQLSVQAADLDAALRKAGTPVERKRLSEELEKVKHQMGPYDAAGARVKCLAMWHDAALEALDLEMKRLAGRPSGSPTAAPTAVDGRLHVRQMAAACLTFGWRTYDGPAKYQVDTFGQYLCNNSKTLDALFDAVAAWAAREAKLDAAGEDRPVYRTALEKAKKGLDRMGAAAEAMNKAAHPRAPAPAAEPAGEAAAEADAAVVALLGEFVQGLAAVRDADAALTDHARKKGKTAGVAPASEAAPAPPAPEPPPMTLLEKERLARIKETAARLTAEAWTPISRALERYAAAIEAGFQVPSARSKAREFLEQIRQAAVLSDSLSISKAAYGDYLKARQAELVAALELMESPLERPRGYAKLAEIWQDDRMRRQLEGGNLTPAAAQSLTRAHYALWPELYRAGTAESMEQGRQVRDSCRVIADTLEQTSAGLARDMAPRLLDCYKQQESIFHSAVERAAAMLSTQRPAAIPHLVGAADRAADLGLLVRADLVVKAVAKYRPARAPAVQAQLLRAAQDLVVGAAGSARARQTLEGLVQPFEELAKFPLPEAEYMRAVTLLAGRFYGPAAAMLSQEVGAAIDAAGTGDTTSLRSTLEARHLFGLLRLRAVADTCHLEKAGAANLAAFSVPEKPWGQFVEALDQRMRLLFAEYLKGPRGRAAWERTPLDWDAVYGTVAAAQRMALDARTEGEAELDFLLRNLEGVAVPAPTTPAYYGWISGYHAIEAAVTMAAGLDTVAEWHRAQVRSYSAYLRAAELDPSKAAAGKPKAAGT